MKEVKLLTLIIDLVFITAFFGGGCVPQVPLAQQRPAPPVQTIDTTHPRARLVTGSVDLVGKVVIRDPRFRTLGQLAQAEVTVQNLTETLYTLEYKFDWTDEQGFTVESPSMWHRFTLTPHEIRNFSSTGKKPEARNITFTIRFPYDAFSK
jgi:uncharacterized protein YcfL